MVMSVDWSYFKQYDIFVSQFFRYSVSCGLPILNAYRAPINSMAHVSQDGSALITEVIPRDHALMD